MTTPSIDEDTELLENAAAAEDSGALATFDKVEDDRARGFTDIGDSKILFDILK